MVQPRDHESRVDFIMRVRAFEQRLQEGMKEIFVPVHLSLGHESVGADLAECIQPEDWLFAPHRNHHLYFAKGGSEEKLWDEIHGLESGMNQGFSGSQAYSDATVNFHASAIVGGLVGVATGTAYALKLNGSKAVTVCVVGDGGTEAGIFWESLNFAVLNHLPICYIVENNGMSVDSPIEDRQATPLRQRAKAFGLEVRGTVKRAINLAREGIPSFYEARVRLECDHINMGSLLPKEVIA